MLKSVLHRFLSLPSSNFNSKKTYIKKASSNKNIARHLPRKRIKKHPHRKK